MRLNLRQVRFAFYLAVGFLGLRILYAFIFAGAAKGSHLILNLQTIQLSGPFRHIALFGPVTLEGLLANLVLALPFSLTIFGFGLLTALIRPAKLFSLAAKSKVGKKLLLAIAISWAQLPSLISGAARAGFAIKLRRERRFRVLIPLLEIAASKAMATAVRISIATTETSTTPGIEVRDLNVLGVRVANLSLQPGSVTVITGSTGSGKSNLLVSLAGIAGELGIPTTGSVVTAGSIGFLPQQPRDNIWGPLVQDEVPSPSSKMLWGKTTDQVQNLSEGEAVQLVLDRELARGPQILLLDEPYAALDSNAANELTLQIEKHRALGGIAVVVEHRFDYLEKLNPNWYQIQDSRLQPGRFKAEPKEIARTNPVVGSETILSIEAKKISIGSRFLFDISRFAIRQGQAVGLSGPNGSGKTTFLKEIAMSTRDNNLAMVPEEASDFFVTQTLGEELQRADRLAKVESGLTALTFRSICQEENFDFATHPRDLSQGTQLALAIAMQLSRKPKIIILDEPVKGLDAASRANVAETLRCVLETGTAVLFATHDSEFSKRLAHVEYRISDQRLLPVVEVSV